MRSTKREEFVAEGHAKTTLKARLITREGKEILVTKVTDDVEKRISRRPHGAVQLVWKNDETGYLLVHIHCKTKDCNNEWKMEEGNDPTERFEIKQLQPTLWSVKCKRCGTEFTSG